MRSLWIRSRPYPSSPSSLSETNGILAVVQDLLLLVSEAERGLGNIAKKKSGYSLSAMPSARQEECRIPGLLPSRGASQQKVV